jgi:hypothetical protein
MIEKPPYPIVLLITDRRNQRIVRTPKPENELQ